MSDVETTCRPGDITVKALPNGFLIRRALAVPRSGDWWECVKIVADAATALDDA